ncbi:olfactory receptor 4Q3-like [Eublepharis macularius]|uniref:Olfactory receptor n=1 Tax=Eublepharis macularius TaxID=481883 RepID=A0AA97K5I9_EUBMA|nr:olfactory receptor 4Q3-like [Eublepharis macularius]
MNVSSVTEFIFLGITCSHPIRLLLFIMVLACYTTFVLGNLLIMVTVNSEPCLRQSPMYFFLASLSIIDTALGCVAAPKLMADLLTSGGTISFGGCMAQVFFLHFFGGSEMLLLTLMAYDRYVAICQPLTYAVSMNRPRCARLLALCWVGGFIHSMTQLVLILRLPFCGPNELDSFYCDVPQVVRLACANTYVTELLMVANSGLLSLLCFFMLLVSYGVIIGTLRGHFKERGGKALSTCSSHLMVVSLFFVPCIFVYLVPFSSSRVDKMASIFYTVVTPALNPIIYTLRNHEMKEAVGRLKNKWLFSCSCVKGEQI